MKFWQKGAALLALVAGFGLTLPAAADTGKQEQIKKALDQDAVCTKCHDETEPKPILSMYKTKHGTRADGRAPGCQSCHGTSDAHVKNTGGSGGTRPPVDVRFIGANKSSPEKISETCVSCHQGGKRMHWAGSQHESRDVACTNCHQVHTQHDKVLAKSTQPEVCMSCHKDHRANLNKPSRHPVKEGKVACSDCHNPHGAAGPTLLVRDNVNDTCYSCHMEKRGPFVWGHEPVREDCSICHNPHGTTTPNLLKARPPFLCQQCHEGTSHRGNMATMTTGAIGTGSGANAQARGCLNCHTQIHGTNNPVNNSHARSLRR